MLRFRWLQFWQKIVVVLICLLAAVIIFKLLRTKKNTIILMGTGYKLTENQIKTLPANLSTYEKNQTAMLADIKEVFSATMEVGEKFKYQGLLCCDLLSNSFFHIIGNNNPNHLFCLRML